MKYKADKLRHKMRVLRRAMREKRGIIIGIRTPPDKREEVLTQTRADLQEMIIQLQALKAEYRAELDKNSNVIAGDDDYYDVD